MRRSSGAFGPISSSSRTPAAVDRDVGVELRRREADARVGLQPVPVVGIVIEESLERGRGLGVAPHAQRDFEHAELRGEDQAERSEMRAR